MADLQFYQEPERLVMVADGKTPLGEITWVLSDDLMIINHTFVVEDYRGAGIGEALVAQAVAIAKEKKLHVLPLCPFAKAEFDKNVAYQELLRKS
ncbi:MAG: N-acetyltransferase [Streptococcaceae bacterium]|jgi:predicted GNAT family acetyltransferase|nr:N-acetyltransferase [Streptococcaceae bacterium]